MNKIIDVPDDIVIRMPIEGFYAYASIGHRPTRRYIKVYNTELISNMFLEGFKQACIDGLNEYYDFEIMQAPTPAERAEFVFQVITAINNAVKGINESTNNGEARA